MNSGNMNSYSQASITDLKVATAVTAKSTKALLEKLNSVTTGTNSNECSTASFLTCTTSEPSSYSQNNNNVLSQSQFNKNQSRSIIPRKPVTTQSLMKGCYQNGISTFDGDNLNEEEDIEEDEMVDIIFKKPLFN